MFLLFTLPCWCQMSWWTFRFTLTHNTELSICRDISLYEKLSTPQNLPYLKQSLGEIPGEDSVSTAIHNPIRVMEQSNWLRYSWFCIRSSARSDLLLVSHEALLTMQQRLPMIFFTFLLLNQEPGVNNECSQSIRSVRHSKPTHRM